MAVSGTVSDFARLIGPAPAGLVKGNLYYQYVTGYNLARPGSHELVKQNMPVMIDTFGNMIPNRNYVDVTGLGFTMGTTYYVEDPNASGKNVVPVPLVNGAAPAALLPSVGRALFTLGECVMFNGRMYLDFRLEANLAVGASWLNVFDISALTVGSAPPATSLLRRVADVNGYNSGSVMLRNDTDSGVSAGFPTSPAQQTIGGTTKNVFLQDVQGTQSKPHIATPGAWYPTQAGDYLALYAVGDNGGAAVGMAWGASATEMYTTRMYGSDFGYVAGQHYLVNAGNTDVSAVNGSDLYQGHGRTTYPAKSYIIQRLLIDGARVRSKFWAYDTSKGMTNAGIEAQTDPNPGTWEIDYTHTAAFPVGEAGYLFDNAELRLIRMAKSYDPQVPARFKAV